MTTRTAIPAKPTLRDALREQTRALHDRLDATLAPLAEGEPEDYAAFLSISFAARRGLEAALRNVPVQDLAPPATSQLIESDLRDLGHAPPEPLAMPAPGADQAIGAAWALGGSSLGNRALLARRAQLGRSGPARFLADRTGAAFFKGLLPTLARPASPGTTRAAIAGAEAVFALFLLAAARKQRDEAA